MNGNVRAILKESPRKRAARTRAERLNRVHRSQRAKNFCPGRFGFYPGLCRRCFHMFSLPERKKTASTQNPRLCEQLRPEIVPGWALS